MVAQGGPGGQQLPPGGGATVAQGGPGGQQLPPGGGATVAQGPQKGLNPAWLLDMFSPCMLNR